MLRFADLERDSDLLEIARQVAGQMLVGDALNVNRHLDRWLGGKTALATV
jgi:ATP-dependent DNA helicase RecG